MRAGRAGVGRRGGVYLHAIVRMPTRSVPLTRMLLGQRRAGTIVVVRFQSCVGERSVHS